MIESHLSWLNERLPAVKIIKLRSEPDYYGISHIIASQIGKKNPPRSFAGWLHGWVFEPIIHERQLAHWGASDDMHLVATRKQAETLRNFFGFTNAEAVGLPFLYVNRSIKIKRKPDSLLIMPRHSLPNIDHSLNQQAYVTQIAKIKHNFSSIIACIHSSCVNKGYWISEFESNDIPWIVGACVNDKNALLRMSIIFRSFEYMSTNILGSHIAYASYSGCKVSIYGSYASYSANDFAENPFYQANPGLEKKLPFLQEEWAKNNFSEFFVLPMEASERQKWGADVLGSQYKKSAREIADLLGWSFSNQVHGYRKMFSTKFEHKLKQLLNSK